MFRIELLGIDWIELFPVLFIKHQPMLLINAIEKFDKPHSEILKIVRILIIYLKVFARAALGLIEAFCGVWLGEIGRWFMWLFLRWYVVLFELLKLEIWFLVINLDFLLFFLVHWIGAIFLPNWFFLFLIDWSEIVLFQDIKERILVGFTF